MDINAGNYEQSGSGSQEELGEGLVDDSLQKFFENIASKASEKFSNFRK